MNTMMQPEKMPLMVCGITTLKIVVSMLAPKSKLASICDSSSFSMAA